MRVVVAGNMGYVGSVLTPYLAARHPDWTIDGIDTAWFGPDVVPGSPLPERRVRRQWFLDLRDLPGEVLDGADAVVNLAAVSNDPMGREFETVTAEINRDACLRLAAAARDAGVKSFIFASSCSTYGKADNQQRNEESSLNPLTAYARSKVESEDGLRRLAGPSFFVTCLRFATACGFSPRVRLDLALNDFVASALSAGRIELLSDGTPWRPLVAVTDMARAIRWAISERHGAGEPFELLNCGANSWNLTVREMADKVAAVLGGLPVTVRPGAGPDPRSYRVDFSRFARLSGDLLPGTTLDEVVAELASGLGFLAASPGHFREGGYVRLNALRSLRQRGLLGSDLRWVSAAAAPAAREEGPVSSGANALSAGR